MLRNELAHDETYFKEYGDYRVSNSYTVYEAFIELQRDKDGNQITNKDGSPRYRYISDSDVKVLNEDKRVKKIREDLFKDVYEVNGDIVELVDKNDRRVYYTVSEDKLTTLPKGSNVTLRNGYYHLLTEVGYVLVEDVDIDNPKVIAVRKFKTEDHKQEAVEIIKAKIHKHSDAE